MKIGYDAKRFFHNTSGLGNYSRDLVRCLAEQFPDNQYLLFAKKPSDKARNILENKAVVFKKISKGFFSRQLKMGTDAENEKCKIFHGLSGELPNFSKNKKIKKIVTIHDLIFLKHPEFYSFFDRKIYYYKFKKAIKQADVIIAISQQTKNDILYYFKVDEQKIEVIYQTCHQAFKKLFNQDELLKVKNKFNLPSRFLLNVGTIEERKNIFSVVRAIESTTIPLVIIGKETTYVKKIRHFIKKHQMENQVIFLQGVSMEELAKIYQLADVFIYPSLYEGFGIPIIEALFSKTATITSNCSCLPEAAGSDSLYINPLDIEDIKSKILLLWNNPQERKIRQEKSYEFVQKFNEKDLSSQLMKIYLR